MSGALWDHAVSKGFRRLARQLTEADIERYEERESLPGPGNLPPGCDMRVDPIVCSVPEADAIRGKVNWGRMPPSRSPEPEVIGYVPIVAHEPGSVVLNAFTLCAECRAVISAYNGPRHGALCIQCTKDQIAMRGGTR